MPEAITYSPSPLSRARCIKHGLRRIDAHEGPVGILAGQNFDLQSSARTVYEYMRIEWRILTEKDTGHTMQAMKARHESGRALSAVGGVIGILE